MYSRVVIWITQASNDAQAIRLLNKRIVKLVKTSGFQFTFQYLKEALRLTIRSLSGSPESKGTSVPRVKRDFRGLPTIIPLPLRIKFCDPKANVNIVRAVLTMLSSGRVFPTTVKVDLRSITDPFSGISKTIDLYSIEAVRKKMRGPKIQFGRFKGFISESAGPNGTKATWSAGIDAFAFIHKPLVLISFIKLSIATKSYGYLTWLLFIIVFLSPIYLISILFRIVEKTVVLGRLSVVLDQPGKARIVGITNWWIQLALKPLHTSIFRFLKTVPMDGTFNQDLPIYILLKNFGETPDKFSCFDLSSATDRLPISFQAQVLHAFGVDGELWKSILNFDWRFKQDRVSYSVGQPMGAYSSWAMLALSHHVIVQVAAHRAGIKDLFTAYAVLGDDIVIKHDKVATEYLALINTLGISINQSKSVVSVEWLEFAKRIRTADEDYSPIGAGNILAFMRRPEFISSLLKEAFLKGYIPISDTVLSLLANKLIIPNDKIKGLGVWTSFSAIGFFSTLSVAATQKVVATYSKGENSVKPMIYQNAYFIAVYTTIMEGFEALCEEHKVKEESFYRNWYRASSVTKRSGLRLIEAFTVLFTPGFWLYAFEIIRAQESLEESRIKLEELRLGTYKDCADLLKLDPASSLSIDWRDKARVKNFARLYMKCNTLCWSTYNKLVSRLDPSDPMNW